MSDESSSPGPQATGDHAALANQFPEDVTGYEVLEDGAGVTVVAPDGIFTVASAVKDMGYRLLSLLSGYDRGDHFGTLYAFVKPANTGEEYAEMRLRVVMPKKDGDADVEPVQQSIVDLYPAADWHEREMWDLYGIHYEGHPDLRRIFMPEGWHGFPGRKDYKEPEQFVAMQDGEDIVLQEQKEGSW